MSVFSVFFDCLEPGNTQFVWRFSYQCLAADSVVSKQPLCRRGLTMLHHGQSSARFCLASYLSFAPSVGQNLHVSECEIFAYDLIYVQHPYSHT